MYFFDIIDYYPISPDISNWLNYGVTTTTVGCAGGPIPDDWENYFTTARATSDAFFKAVNNWFIESSASGYTESLDVGCSPSYKDLYGDYNNLYIDFIVARTELYRTVPLHKYYYDWLVEVNAPGSEFPYMVGGTYESYIEYFLNEGNYSTGTTTGNINIYNPFTESKVDSYETTMKSLLCGVKNMWSIMDGDTFDELVVDGNDNFLPNSGYTYSLI
jgi:hypothetical protein